MSTGSGPKAPDWRTPPPPSTAPPAPPGPPWAAPPPPREHRPRWWKLAAVALFGLLVLAAVVWVALWIRPTDPARLIVQQAGYDTNLAVPVNPYGKAAARDLAALTKPGGWFSDRPKLNGSTEPDRFARGPLLPGIESTRERCVVVVLAAHGGRDRDGAFLFPDDATADPCQRIRVKAIIDRLAALPARKQKLLILDATQNVAYPDLGLVHNDFAAALLDLEGDIRAVPNLVVFSSTGLDERSWVSPEWGTSAFAHYLTDGLNGAADADRDKRVSGDELIGYVQPRVRNWARDHRAARQVPMVLPRDEGERRLQAMHLAMTDGKTPAQAAPVPFDPPLEVEQIWNEYRDLARGTPPPQAYTPHLWREYEAWVLRFEQLVLAGDDAGARAVHAKATDARRRIEAARLLDVAPQTLALPAGVGGMPHYAEPPAPFLAGIARIADPAIPASQRATEWAKQKAVPGFDTAAVRIQWVRALLRWVAVDPANRLPIVPEVVPLISEGFALRPAELHFVVMLAARLPSPETLARMAPMLREVLALRTQAEAAAMCLPDSGYPYADFCQRWVDSEIARGDTERRQAEDLCFATEEASWNRARQHVIAARARYDAALTNSESVRALVSNWNEFTQRYSGLSEWLCRDLDALPAERRLAREATLRNELRLWHALRSAGMIVNDGDGEFADRTTRVKPRNDDLCLLWLPLERRLVKETTDLLAVRPEFEGTITPRAEAVRWFLTADGVLTAPPADVISPAERRDLLREYRRVSRQLQVTGIARPESLPEVSEPVNRELAFDAARRRGLFLLARFGPQDFTKLAAGIPGDSYDQVEFRLSDFAGRADGRKSLADASSRLGEILAALPAAADVAAPNADADRMLRLVAAASVPGIHHNPADLLRRARTRTVLVTQTQRTVLDHWYAENEGKYYLRAAAQLRADANRIFPSADPKSDPFAELVRADDEPFPVEPVLPKSFAMTDEPDAEFTLTFTRQADRSGRPGFPVFSADPPFAPSTAVAERTPYGTDPDSSPTPFVRTVRGPVGPKPVTPAPISGTIRVNGFYRGRTISRTVAANAYPTPNLTAVSFPNSDPSTAIAVRADPALLPMLGYGNGTVVIVLDCSGSMRPPVAPKSAPPHPDDFPAASAPEGQFAAAAKALNAVLNGLPPGTVVVVRTFGRKSSGATTAEGSMQTLLPPTRLDFDRTTIVDKVMGEVNAIPIGDLWFESPVVHSVVDAKDWLKSQPGMPGPFKAVVLISDQADNRVPLNPRFNNPPRPIKDILKGEFLDTGVFLGVVALKVTDPVEVKIQEEFRAVERFNPPGRMVPAEKAGELAVWLRTGLIPRIRFNLAPALSADAGSLDPTEVSTSPSDPDNWFTRPKMPGRYVVQVNGDLVLNQEVFLRPGDRLWLDLTEQGGELRFTRRWFAKTWPNTVAQVGNPGWQMAALQNYEKDGKVRIVAAIDDRPKPQAVIVQSTIPESWFDLSADAEKPAPMSVRWRPEPGFPGPSWTITTLGGWPAGKSPILGAHWSDPNGFRAAASWTAPGGHSPIGIRHAALGISDSAVSLDSVAFEEHSVEVAPDRFEKRLCLVARVSHSPENAAWVRPMGFTPLGSEVRLYSGANRTTCLFWWDATQLSPTQVNRLTTGFEVVSKRDAFAEAEADGRSLKLTGMPPPSDKSPPPTPPVPLVKFRN